jgi:hypothetical protein
MRGGQEHSLNYVWKQRPAGSSNQQTSVKGPESNILLFLALILNDDSVVVNRVEVILEVTCSPEIEPA